MGGEFRCPTGDSHERLLRVGSTLSRYRKANVGYRGTPAAIPLGFDASKASHRFAIEWDPCEIRWFVDGELVHRRAAWNPTPIPQLPMTLHVNTWPARSRELAGRLTLRALPASAIVRSIAVDALNAGAQALAAGNPVEGMTEAASPHCHGLRESFVRDCWIDSSRQSSQDN